MRLAKMLHDAGVRDDHGCIANDAKFAEGRHEWYPEVEMLKFGNISVDVDEWRNNGTFRVRASGLGMDDAIRVVTLLRALGR